jgi:hypothetical protein
VLHVVAADRFACRNDDEEAEVASRMAIGLASAENQKGKSMKIVSKLIIGVALALCMGVVTGCPEEGAGEKAGKAIDGAVEDLQDDADEAKKKLE